MTPFLQLTARDLYDKFGDNLPSVAVVFPNNRARLFFSEYLWQAAGKPVWTPVFTTISDLFRDLSDLNPADDLELTVRLYQIFRTFSSTEETFDEFEPWGEILLSDFDDVDKNMADAVQLFRNIREWGEYTDTLEHLSEEQVASIRLFFKNFDPDRKTELKRRFMENWNLLAPVYEAFKSELAADGLAFEGMLYRRVVERFKATGIPDLPCEKYVFVGFNVLNECEIQWFNLLQKAGKALFYWDYDSFYMEEPLHEAGRFMRQNLERFPGQLDPSCFDSFRQLPKTIRFLSAPTENAQARFLPEWISQLREVSDFRAEETAVVLCNENLLLPVLHSVPDDVTELNVTMGFPLQQTPVCTLVNQIVALHADGFLPGGTPRFNHRYILPILQHPLIRQFSDQAEKLETDLRTRNSFRPSVAELTTPKKREDAPSLDGEQEADELLETIFTPRTSSYEIGSCLLDVLRLLGRKQVPVVSSEPEFEPGSEPEDQPEIFPDEYEPLHAEALFRCHTLLSRLQDLMSRNLVELGVPVYRRLLQQLLSRTTIPFSGEPVRGMQIMGLLETRNLDFKNVLLLSVNEGMLPKGVQDTSFIPYNLRKAFGLTTPEHKDSVFAYYFFRLLQRAENISLIYNTATEGLNRGEMSRFMLQLLVESSHPVTHHNLRSDIGLASPRVICIDKTPEILGIMREKMDLNTHSDARQLSPTALNCLLDCPLRFYFRYVAGMKEPDEVTDDIDSAVLGNFFHHSAQYIYTHILLRKAGMPHDTASVDEAIKSDTLNKGLDNGSICGIIDADDLKPWMEGAHSVEKVVDHYFRRDFFKCQNQEEPEYHGEHLIKKRLVTGFLQTLLRLDSERAPFEVIGLEKETGMMVQTPEGTKVRLGGIIDRIDRKEGRIRVLDYKTGGIQKNPSSMESLFDPTAERANHVFQTFVYCAALADANPDVKVYPEICYIHKAGSEKFTSEIKLNREVVNPFNDYSTRFLDNINLLISNLFKPDHPFSQTSNPLKCAYCDYKNLCRK